MPVHPFCGSRDAKVSRIRDIAQSSDLWSLAGLRLIPIAPFTIVNLVAGISGVRLRDFLVGTLIGMGPGILLICLSVDRARAALAGEPVFDPWIIAAIARGTSREAPWCRRNLTPACVDLSLQYIGQQFAGDQSACDARNNYAANDGSAKNNVVLKRGQVTRATRTTETKSSHAGLGYAIPECSCLWHLDCQPDLVAIRSGIPSLQ